MILQIVKLKSSMKEDELLRIAHERKAQIEAIPGLLQKFYVKGNDEGEYRGVYVWDSKESLMTFRDSELAKTIPAAYKTIEAPSIEVLDILFLLRDL